jgi:hypothetical protein
MTSRKKDPSMTSRREINDKIGSMGIQGQYVVYGVGAYGTIGADVCELRTDSWLTNDRKALRAYRSARRRAGKKVCVLDDQHLVDELLVAFGPEMSAEQAVSALERLARDIKANGLFIGCGKPTEDLYYLEKVDGTVVPS